MKARVVTYTLETLPSLTEGQRANLRALSAHPDHGFDSVAPKKAPNGEWEKAELRDFYRPLKRQITTRVDADVLEWLKSQGKGHQSRINAILRREMQEALRAGAK